MDLNLTYLTWWTRLMPLSLYGLDKFAEVGKGEEKRKRERRKKMKEMEVMGEMRNHYSMVIREGRKFMLESPLQIPNINSRMSLVSILFFVLTS